MNDELLALRDLGVAFLLALGGGLLAVRLRQPPLVGYLLAGVIIGPFTPGFVGNEHNIAGLAEIGIIFLMFTLGVEFSLDELARVKRIALLGTGLQLAGTALLGVALGFLLGWTGPQSLYMGALLSLSSTVVILKTLMARGEVDSAQGKVLIGILIVQDLAAVGFMVILPALTGSQGTLAPTLLTALGKTVLFIGGTLLLGTRVVPQLVRRVARLQSDELFIVTAAAVALGAALGATALGLSTALGAFLAGLLVGSSDVRHRVMAEIIPLRDLLTSLFFVSVGMLIDPSFLLHHPLLVVCVAAAVLLIKAVIASSTALLPTFQLSSKTALFVGLGLAQVGEFSFVLARQGVDQGILSAQQYSLILTISVVTLVATPGLFWSVPRVDLALARIPLLGGIFRPGIDTGLGEGEAANGWQNHVLVVGCGQVGGRVARALHTQGAIVVCVDHDLTTVERLREEGLYAIYGDASYKVVLDAGRPHEARVLVVALPDSGAARVVVLNAGGNQPGRSIVVRARTASDARVLHRAGAQFVVEPELEGGIEMLRRVLDVLDIPPGEQTRVVQAARA